MKNSILKAMIIVLSVVMIGLLVGITVLLSQLSDYNDLNLENQKLIEDNKVLQIEKDSINEIRSSYHDSLTQVRLDRAYFEKIIIKFDSVLTAIPKKYEKDRNIVRSGDIDGTIGILSSY